MRILWLDQTTAPWKQADGWDILSRYDLDFVRAQNAADARETLKKNRLDVAVVNADLNGGLDLVAEIKSGAFGETVPVILVSSRWGKKDFKSHSLSPGAADNYARLPLPVQGFIDVLRALTNAELKEGPAKAAGIAIDAGSSASGSISLAGHDEASALLTGESAVPPPAPAGRSPIEVLKAALRTPWRKEESETPEEAEPAPPELKPLPKVSKADGDVLKKYLEIREKELEQSLREKQRLERSYERLTGEVDALKAELRDLERKRQEIEGKSERLERRAQEHEKQLVEARERAGVEKESLLERVRLLERELEETRGRYGSLKDRVRRDIRKIQAREKELETRLELVKRDSETLIGERDRQVLELRRKIDALEFDLDLLQDKKIEAENTANRYVEKLGRVARTLDLAIGMLADEESEPEEPTEEIRPLIGGAATNPHSKNPVVELSSEELEAAEAPTKIFAKDEVADQLLARVAGDSEPEGGEDAGGDGFDQALGS